MRAHLGDQLVVESPANGATRRDGEIVGLHHEDGTPPYDVHWSDTDEVTLVFPGADAHIRHLEHGTGGALTRFPLTWVPGRAQTRHVSGRVPGPTRHRRTGRPTPVTSAAAWPPNAGDRD